MTKKETQVPDAKGLAQLRNNPDAPLTFCSNCKCERYGECGCQKKKK